MFQEVEKQLLALLREGVEKAFQASSAGPVPELILNGVTLEIPKDKTFGDLSCSIAMKLSSHLRKSPQAIAALIVGSMKESQHQHLFAGLEIKGAGFINIFLARRVYDDLLRSVNEQAKDFGRTQEAGGRKLLLEFVSANPTGALSVAHARQAAVGDALANILEMAGYDVTREYYLNDEGNQIRILGRSIGLRYQELEGKSIVFPEEYYQGEYIIDLAREVLEDQSACERLRAFSDIQKEEFFMEFGTRRIMEIIRRELDAFCVRFDNWYSQKALTSAGMIEKALEEFKARGYIYEEQGAVWFRSTAFGDDKDRVVRKTDGSYTYLAPDIAYHQDKFRRGFERLVNIWGPDHHGYIPRMKAAIQAMGHDKDAMDVIIVQLATLFRKGVPVPMSTRKGQYVTLTEVLNEVGRDAGRFFFLMRKTDSHLDFDLELAKKQTQENPVYYVQYAHARICGILNSAGTMEQMEEADLALLAQPEERDLMRSILEYPFCLQMCANQLDPYAMTVYLQSLASSFHRFYDRHKVLSEHTGLTAARLFLIRAVRNVLANGLTVLGVTAPERM
ncbi:MAG: arginine--tRNA ligase [Candidatus Omnitrophota bacterium]